MTLTEIQQALARLETRPRQSLGQNFLHDQNLARWIVAQLDLQPGEHVVEIGPGLGALTEYLVESGCHVTCIEKDGTMVHWLGEKFRGADVELFHMDALKFDLRKLYGRGPVKLVGNLPYYVSTPLIAKYTSALSPASILVLTLQHEVAARLCATPGTKDFGAMSVCSARRWDIRYARKLPASVFYPAPQVSSAVVTMRRKPAGVVPACDETLFESLVRRGFGERRKQLRKLLPEYRASWPELCAALGVPETVRAEELTLAQWENLARLVRPARAQSGGELFDVVDAGDRVIDTRPRDDVHVNNLRHRAVHMLIFNSAGELLLQKRSIWKDRNPGLWDSSAAGHVDAGETYAAAAQREIVEEIGISCPLEPLGRLPCSESTGWEFIEVFRGRHDGPFRPAPLEIETAAFFPLPQVRAWMERTPEDFSPVFRQVMALVA
jgi:dimethyladenosine transferase